MVALELADSSRESVHRVAPRFWIVSRINLVDEMTGGSDIDEHQVLILVNHRLFQNYSVDKTVEKM